MIRSALAELMEEKGFDGITVNELTVKADINRGTFYLHYRDKQDLLEKCEDEIITEINEIIKAALQLRPEEVVKLRHHFEPFPFVIKLFEYILENSPFIKVILGPKGNPSFK
ncbi:hypothetical protein N752_27125 [Desulforamulus aquiferis]|nr:hypothetical protein N752_27125 [Desulforamulus aquiferis]